MTKHILLVEDDIDLRMAIQDTLESAGYRVTAACNGQQALESLQDCTAELVISDINMPVMDGVTLLKKINENIQDVPVVLITAFGTIEQAVEAMRYGAVDYLVKPFEAEVLINAVIQNIRETIHCDRAIAVDHESVKLFTLARKVAKSDASILISGESGTGKEVLARYIHDNSPRSGKPFVAINCAAIPENMLEATLFGYEKGAFTGAYKASPGKFEQANGGTLLLDEVTEMPLELQAKLLRVIQEREVERIGSNNTIALDIRILSTTNRNMVDFVRDKSFREDLYYRLNVFPIEIPALRHRLKDVIPIAESFLANIAKREAVQPPVLTDAAKLVLQSHTWPGNIRELENTIHRAMILHSGTLIDRADILITEEVRQANSGHGRMNSENSIEDRLNTEVRSHEWDVILNTIRAVGGSRKATAEQLGISPRTLRYKLAKMREAGIDVPETFVIDCI